MRFIVSLIVKFNREKKSLTYIHQKLMKMSKKLNVVYEHIFKNVIKG